MKEKVKKNWCQSVIYQGLPLLTQFLHSVLPFQDSKSLSKRDSNKSDLLLNIEPKKTYFIQIHINKDKDWRENKLL